MKEIRDIINKLENELHSTTNPYIVKNLEEDIEEIYIE